MGEARRLMDRPNGGRSCSDACAAIRPAIALVFENRFVRLGFINGSPPDQARFHSSSDVCPNEPCILEAAFLQPLSAILQSGRC